MNRQSAIARYRASERDATKEEIKYGAAYPATLTPRAFGRQCKGLNFSWEQACWLFTRREGPGPDNFAEFEDGYNEGTKPCLHFVGFKGDEYTRAVRLFGRPDFIHRQWDLRAPGDVDVGDVIIFATGSEYDDPYKRTFNDSEYVNGRDDGKPLAAYDGEKIA